MKRKLLIVHHSYFRAQRFLYIARVYQFQISSVQYS